MKEAILKALEDRYNAQISEADVYLRLGETMISGGVDNMEKYQYMLGQARTYQYILQEISNLLEEKEQKDEGNIIDIGKGSS
jgi:hypothetical protein